MSNVPPESGTRMLAAALCLAAAAVIAIGDARSG